MAKILLVEDDWNYARMLSDFLITRKHVIEIAGSAEDAQNYLDVYQFDVIVADWRLPGTEGPAFIRTLREAGTRTPILMLTARGELKDKESGFIAGADDYLTKDSHPLELLMRVQALLRRPPGYRGNSIRMGEIEVDTFERSVTKNGTRVHLKPQEYALLEFLARSPHRVFSSEELLERLWPSDTIATLHTIRSHVNKIRAKLDDSLILTKYKAGYQINANAR